jgi:tetratricopeptide (TPR) repeat protein
VRPKKCASSKRALIIIDNVSKTSGQDQSLKKLYGLTCSVIITSRYNNMERFDAFRINHLSLEECKRVFSSIYGSSSPGEQADLEYILGKLAALHTKTVGLLAFMSGNKGWTISGLKKKLDEKKFDLSYIVDGRKTTLQTEYEKLFDLAGLTESEINILESFSLFPPLPLSIDICSRWMNKDANAGEDDELFNTLYQKGWLERDGNLFFMHPVVAEVIYAKQKPEISRHTKLLEACAESIRINETEVFTRVLPYMPFAEAAVQEMYDEGSHIIAVLADLIGCIYCKSGDYVKAQDWLEKGLNINEKVFGIDHLNTTGSLNNLAGLYCIMGRYKEAELLFRRALQIRSETLGEVHSDTALCLNKLAELYHSLGRYEEAELLYTRALSIVQTIFGEKHMYAAIVLNNQAGLYRSLGRYEEAESLYKRSLSIREEILGGMHPSMAACLNDLAGLYKYNGRYKEAEFLYKRALAICKEALGEKHPDTAKCLNNLALLYPIHGKYEEAESLYKQAIVVCEEILGERHPDTAVCLKNLAMLYESQGRYEEAESMYKKSLSIREELFGQRHLLTASCLDDLAGFYESHGKYEKAESLYKRALSIYKEVLGEEHPTAVKIMNNLEELYKLRT